MSKVIEDAKIMSDALNGGQSKITGDLKEILKEAAIHKDGVIMEIPFEAEVDGGYMEAITVVVTKVTKERVYFINPAKVSRAPGEITEKDKKGPNRRIEPDGFESMEIGELLKLSKKKPVLGIIREK
jgi:hypothetical protein